jgi:3-oxoacyl-[acyl-carrier-protein] synthase-3
MPAVISALHYCVPAQRLTQTDLAARFGTGPVQSIAKMSGIRERRVAPPGVTAADLAYVAARGLLAARAVDPATIDLLIFASQTPDYQIPATACILQHRLGLPMDCAAFDLNQGCSAFPYTLAVADGLITSGVAKRALLLNADTVSHIIHPQDRSLLALHGDGAAATLLEPAMEDGTGLRGFALGSDGSGAPFICVPASGARQSRNEATRREKTDEAGNVRTDEHLGMNGPAVFHFSVSRMPDIIRSAVEKWGLTLDELDLVLLHQANRMMVDLMYKNLKIAEDRRFYFMETVGNLAGASVAVVLAEAWRQGRVKPGSLTLLVAFGNGLSWGLALHRWPRVLPTAVSAPVDYAIEQGSLPPNTPP